MTSKIREELVAMSKLSPKRGEDDAAFMTRVHYEIAGKISDADWAALSSPAQDWNNAAAITIDNKQPLPVFSDEVAAEPATTSRRRGAAANTGLPEPFVPKLGAPVIITTKRGKVSTGIIVDLNDDEIVINAKGEAGEKEDDLDFVLSAVTVQPAPPVLNEASAQAQAAGGKTPAEPDEPMTPEVGDTVQVVTSRDKTIMGSVIEVDVEGDVLVLKDTAGVDHELVPSRLKDCVVKHRPSAAAAAGAGQPENKLGVATAAPATGRGRRGAGAVAPEAGGATAGEEDGGKVTVGAVIRDTLVNNPDATEADCEAALKKAGLPFSPVTVKVAYKATQSTVKAVLRKHGVK